MMGSYLKFGGTRLKMNRTDECWPTGILGTNFPFLYLTELGSVTPVFHFYAFLNLNVAVLSTCLMEKEETS